MHLYRIEGYTKFDTRHPLIFEIIRETPKGWWIESNGEEKWVSKTGRKRFAYPTKQQAERNYIARKKSQIQHNIRSIERAKEGLYALGVKPTNVKIKQFIEEIL